MLAQLGEYPRRLGHRSMPALGLDFLGPQRPSIALGATMVWEVRRQRLDVDAIFFCNDNLEQGVLLGALRIGLKVPQDVAVAGFNDLTGSDQMLPALTTVRTPRTEIGTRAAQRLLALMRKEPVEEPSVNLDYELVIREST